MPDFGEYFRSVGDVWVIWFLSIIALGLLTCRALSHVSWRNLKRVLGNEDEGSSYALAYVMTFPFYLILAALMIESSLILIVKFGTMNAAYASARAAIVWRSVEPEAGSAPDDKQLAESKAQDAAVLAMTPFASSIAAHAQKMFPGSPAYPSLRGLLYYQAYKTIEGDNIKQDPHRKSFFIRSPDAVVAPWYSDAKFRFAQLATRVTVVQEPNEWNGDVTVTVQYEMPMHVPGAGRILGNPWQPSRYYARIITSTVTLPSETARSANGRIGIGYDPRY